MNKNSCPWFAGFPSVPEDEWRRAVERDLKGASFEKRLLSRLHEGLTIEPLFTSRQAPPEPDPSGFPGFPPFIRGGRFGGHWDLRQEYADPDLEESRAAIRDDLAHGASSLWLVPGRNGRQGKDPAETVFGAGEKGLMLSSCGDFVDLLEGVDLAKIPVVIDAGGAGLPLAVLFLAAARQRKVDAKVLSGCLGADPLGGLARDGQLPFSLDETWNQAALLARWTSRETPGLRSLMVSTVPYHDAGAHAVQELAMAAATGLEALRRLEASGLDLETAALQIQFAFAVGQDLFVELAKLRAARMMWARVVEASGCSPSAQRMVLHARGSFRVLTACDPWVNLLRITLQGFTAAAGGADSLCTPSFDEVLGPADEFSRRLARNAQIILAEEAHLGRVIDPAGGSWYIETLTRQLAQSAWSLFQEIEQRGGAGVALQSGWIQEQVAAVAAQRRQSVAKRKEPITGVSEFPHLRETEWPHRSRDLAALARSSAGRQKRPPVEVPTDWVKHADPVGALIEAASRGATLGRITQALSSGTPARVVRLESERQAAPFEKLRTATRLHRDKTGAFPQVFLANLGPIPRHKLRATFAANFFEAGGIEALGNDGFETPEAAAEAFRISGAPLVVICSTDETYVEQVPRLAPLLRQNGARAVIMAGRPGDHEAIFREAGVDTFIFLGCDVLAVLDDLLRRVGVIS